jgi:hypothetical protein
MDLEILNQIKAFEIDRKNLINSIQIEEDKRELVDKKIIKYQKYNDIFVAVRDICVQYLQSKYQTIQNQSLKDIMPDRDYKFCIDIKQKYNHGWIDLEVEKQQSNGVSRFVKLNKSGNGITAILRESSLIGTLLISGNRRVLVLDEEMTALSKDHQDRNYMQNMLVWLKTMLKEFNIQMIQITHEKQIKDYADKLFYVINEDGNAKVNII